MRIQKTSRQPASSGLLPGHLEDINRLSRASLSAEEVYVFSLCLCDNEVDRDQERFPEKTLEQLAPLFVGKSGLFDHSWSARGQAARLYRTEVVREPERLTQAGDGYCWLKGWAYMVRTPDNQGLIAEIEGGHQEGGQRGLRCEAGGMLHLQYGAWAGLRTQARGGL